MRDLVRTDSGGKWFEYEGIHQGQHDCGCTRSSVVAAEAAKGDPPLRAYSEPRRLLQQTLERRLNIGRGRVLLNLMQGISGFSEIYRVAIHPITL
ncbi:MAG: bifunctional hydroxymethylpyrimidine kinase/phosphomethylpyrimidine kinase [Thermoprotei archaeon]